MTLSSYRTSVIPAIRASHPAKGAVQPLLRALWKPWVVLWLSLPTSIRRHAYSALWWIGKKFYPDGDTFTQELPFGLFAKRGPTKISRSATLANIYVANNTTIPVPTVLDFLEDEDYSLTIMTRLPGTSVRGPMLSGQLSESYFEATIRDWLTQLRNLPVPDTNSVSAFDGGQCYSYRVTHDPFGPFPDIPSFHQKLLQMCPPREQERLKGIVSKSHDKTHRVVFSHGDLHVHNILVDNGKLSGLIDWDCAGWYPEYWDYAVAIYHIRRHPFWVGSFSRIFPQYEEELEVEKVIWEVHFPW